MLRIKRNTAETLNIPVEIQETKMNKKTIPYTYQILSKWDINSGTPEEIKEFDSLEKALEIGRGSIARGEELKLYVAKISHKLEAIRPEPNIEETEIK